MSTPVPVLVPTPVPVPGSVLVPTVESEPLTLSASVRPVVPVAVAESLVVGALVTSFESLIDPPVVAAVAESLTVPLSLVVRPSLSLPAVVEPDEADPGDEADAGDHRAGLGAPQGQGMLGNLHVIGSNSRA